MVTVLFYYFERLHEAYGKYCETRDLWISQYFRGWPRSIDLRIGSPKSLVTFGEGLEWMGDLLQDSIHLTREERSAFHRGVFRGTSCFL